MHNGGTGRRHMPWEHTKEGRMLVEGRREGNGSMEVHWLQDVALKMRVGREKEQCYCDGTVPCSC